METNKTPAEKITFSDLRPHYQTGRAVHISGTGRNKVFGYRHGVMTDLGDLARDEWKRLAKQVIERSGEQELYQNLLEWEIGQENDGYLTDEQLEYQTLDSCMSRVFDDQKWVDYIPFNQKYRPEVLDKADLVWVKCTACGKRQQMTRVRYEYLRSTFESQLYCTNCGGFATLSLAELPEEGTGNG